MSDAIRDILVGIEAESTLHEITSVANEAEMWLTLILMDYDETGV